MQYQRAMTCPFDANGAHTQDKTFRQETKCGKAEEEDQNKPQLIPVLPARRSSHNSDATTWQIGHPNRHAARSVLVRHKDETRRHQGTTS